MVAPQTGKITASHKQDRRFFDNSPAEQFVKIRLIIILVHKMLWVPATSRYEKVQYSLEESTVSAVDLTSRSSKALLPSIHSSNGRCCLVYIIQRLCRQQSI